MFLLWLFKVSGILRFSTWSLNEALPWGLWEFCSHEKSTDIIASRKTEKLGIYCLEVYQIYWFPWNDCSCSAGGDLEAPGGWIVPSSCGRYSWSEIQMCPEAVGWCCCGGHPSFRKLPPGRPILPRLCRCSLVLLKYFTCVVFFCLAEIAFEEIKYQCDLQVRPSAEKLLSIGDWDEILILMRDLMSLEGNKITYSRLSSSSLWEVLNETLAGHRNGVLELLFSLLLQLPWFCFLFSFKSRHY